MSELDLSFASRKEDLKPAEVVGNNAGLDLSFAGTKEDAPAQDQRSFTQKTKDFFTGNDRETEQTQTLPEFDLPTHFALTRPGATAKTALGLLTTFDEKGQLKILKTNFPKIEFSEDEKGNIIIDATKEGGGKGVLNMPGISARDMMQLGFQVAAFAPAKAAAAASFLKGAFQVGAKSGGIQAAQDLASQAAGREDEVRLSNIDKGDVGFAAGVGGAAQMVFKTLAPIFPALRRQITESGITDKVRATFRDAAVKSGLSPDDVNDEMIKGMLRQADEAVSTDKALALQGEAEFGIPLTKGQRSLDDAQLSTEDAMRAGSRGEGAQRVVRGFETEQQIPAINAAKDQVSSQIGGPTTNQGGVVKESIRAAERAGDDAVSEAFEQVGDASLTPDGMSLLLKNTRQSVRGMEFDPTLPQTANVLKQIKGFEKTINTFKGKGLRPTDLNKIEQIRRRLNTAVGAAEKSDKRQVVIMKNAFDDALDDAVINSLFTGDAQALGSLKSARKLFADYAKKFRANPKKGKSGRVVDRDEPGQFIEKIVSANPTDEQVINAVFGASGLNKGAGRDMAIRFREILGKDSEGWGAIRQAAFKRLIKTNTVNGKELVSGQKTIKAINEALEKNGTLVREIFSPEEISLLRRFAVQVKRTQPDLVKSRENPSGTAQALTKTVSDLTQKVSQMLALKGDFTLFAGMKGVEATKGFRGSSQAKDAVRPFKLIDARPGLVSGSTATAVTAQ